VLNSSTSNEGDRGRNDVSDAPDIVIRSAHNPKVKAALRLRDRRDRDREGRFLIEGYRELSRAIEAGWPLERVFYCPDWFLGNNEPALLERCRDSGAHLVCTSKKVFARLSYRDRPEGLLAVAPAVRRGLEDLTLPDARAALILVAESIEKPGNLGTILRSADAAGVHAVIVCDRRTDVFNPNVVRASLGTLFTVQTVEADTSDAIRFLRDRGIRITAATPHARDVYTDVDMTAPVAVVVGSEQYGLSEQWLDAADVAVRIPMYGSADSLNVAASAIVLLYEAVRQRRAAGILE